ncbi:MAG: ABC transporter permease [Clostridia bacterium]
MKNKRALRFSRKYLTIPYGIFMFIFIVVPLIIVVMYAFSVTKDDGSLTFQFTLENFKTIFSGSNGTMLANSLLVGLVTTTLCLLIGYPIAYMLNNTTYNKSRIMVLLFMLPMWINFLLRTLATQAIFQALAIKMGMGTVIFGMVYNYLPFMIMPIYTTIQKIDKTFLEGAQDLGASPRAAFWKITMPLSMPGVLSGITMVFMPTITTFAISGLLSNNTIGLVGDYIYSQISKSFNIASAMSFVILIIIGISMMIVNKYDKDSNTSGGGLW